jgi:hypothetical protein
VYDSDPDDVVRLGWEEFVARQWESIFVGYRSWTGLRTIGRRWCDLFEAGLNCSQDVAARLVRDVIINGPDRQLEGAAGAQALASGMIDVLADVREGLADMADLGPELSARLLDQHAQLLSFVDSDALADDDEEAPQP